MSDYIPNPMSPNPRDPYRDPNYNFAPGPGSGSGVYVVVGALVVAVLVAGFLLFSGPASQRMDQARAPDRLIESPVTPADRMPATPAPTAPTPITPPTTQQ